MTAQRKTLRLQERGFVDVDAQTWKALSAESEFWALVENGVLTVSQPRRGGMRLGGTRYVGVAHIAGIDLEISEKTAGTVRALMTFASARAFRVTRVASPETELGDLTAILVHQFVAALRKYVSRGRENVFDTQGSVSPFIRGRLNVVRTLQLAARGLGHLVASERSYVNYRRPKNIVLLAALREIEAINKAIVIEREDMASARSLAMLFSDCRTTEVVFGRRQTWVARAEELLEASRDSESKDLLGLAGILLAHRGFEHDAVRSGSVPRAWFLNLEELFEIAVRRVMSELVASPRSVQKGGDCRRHVFAGVKEKFRASPDIVIGSAQACDVIADVKHKEWTGSGAHSDVYQLLVHAAAYDASQCCLIYPSNSYRWSELGHSVVGPIVDLFAVDVRCLDTDLSRILRELGIPVREVESAVQARA